MKSKTTETQNYEIREVFYSWLDKRIDRYFAIPAHPGQNKPKRPKSGKAALDLAAKLVTEAAKGNGEMF